MKQLLERTKKWIKLQINKERKYSVNDWVKTIGGFCIVISPFLLIAVIWVDSEIILNILKTDFIVLAVCWIIDR